MARWHIGDLYRVTATFKDAAEVPTNPTNARLAISRPDGTYVEVVPTSDGAGAYHHDLYLDLPGNWEVGWLGSGAVTTAEPNRFYVSPSRVLAWMLTP